MGYPASGLLLCRFFGLRRFEQRDHSLPHPRSVVRLLRFEYSQYAEPGRRMDRHERGIAPRPRSGRSTPYAMGPRPCLSRPFLHPVGSREEPQAKLRAVCRTTTINRLGRLPKAHPTERTACKRRSTAGLRRRASTAGRPPEWEAVVSETSFPSTEAALSDRFPRPASVEVSDRWCGCKV